MQGKQRETYIQLPRMDKSAKKKHRGEKREKKRTREIKGRERERQRNNLKPQKKLQKKQNF